MLIDNCLIKRLSFYCVKLIFNSYVKSSETPIKSIVSENFYKSSLNSEICFKKTIFIPYFFLNGFSTFFKIVFAN